MPYTIYVLTNRVNGLRYVGFTGRSIRARWKQHRRDARKGSTLAFHEAVRCFGPAVFDGVELQVVDTLGNARLAEREWIARLRTKAPGGYNLSEGHTGTAYATLLAEQEGARQRRSEKTRQAMVAEQASRQQRIERETARAQAAEMRRATEASRKAVYREGQRERANRLWADPDFRIRQSAAVRQAVTPKFRDAARARATAKHLEQGHRMSRSAQSDPT